MIYLKRFNESIDSPELEQEINDCLVELIDQGFYIDVRKRDVVIDHNIYKDSYEVLISLNSSGYSPFFPKKIIEPINVLIDYFTDKFTNFRHNLRYVDDYEKYQNLKYKKGGYIIPKDLETGCLSLQFNI